MHKERNIPVNSNGPLFGMPVFYDGNEIMSTRISDDGKTITIFCEDADEPGKLNPFTLDIKDYNELLRTQPDITP